MSENVKSGALGSRGNMQPSFWVVSLGGFVKSKMVLMTFQTIAETKEQAEAIGLLRWRDENPKTQDCAVIANGPYISAPATSA